MDNLTVEQRKKNMRHIQSRDTEIERLLRKALWDRGYRYRKNYKKLPGKPDIVILKYKIAIFCDSEFFHGKDWNKQKERIKKCNNSQYWVNKIANNIDRDKKIDKKLALLGWKVLRFWGKDIKKHIEECIKVVDDAVIEAIIENKGIQISEQ